VGRVPRSGGQPEEGLEGLEPIVGGGGRGFGGVENAGSCSAQVGGSIVGRKRLCGGLRDSDQQSLSGPSNRISSVEMTWSYVSTSQLLLVT
jgi:hypothetical protein